MSRPHLIGVLTVAIFAAGNAQAHTTIWPREAKAGAFERFTVRVPTEGKVATTSAELEAPPGVAIGLVAAPAGYKQTLKRDGDRITGITWEMNLAPNEFMEFTFFARTPKDAKEVVWILRQKYSDGKVEDWTKGPEGTRPTAVTKLTPRADEEIDDVKTICHRHVDRLGRRPRNGCTCVGDGGMRPRSSLGKAPGTVSRARSLL